MRMAKLIIDIINPTISLISKPSTSSNKCEGTLEFTIKSTPNASIIIVATIPSGQVSKDDLRELAYDLGSGYQLAPNFYRTTAQYPFLSTDQWTKYKEITLNNTGEAKVRVVLANSEKAGEYLTTKVYVKDVTNNKEETKEFTRYNDDIKCKIGLEPIAINDNATIDSGTSKNIYILQNDERIHYIPDLNNVTILTQPTHGTVSWLFGYARYTNNGDGATTDFFTYTVETPNGLSNTATVNITINQAPLVIENDTNIRIYFDASGSMNSTLSPLQSMRDTLLKDKLISYYNNDINLYNSKVKILEVALNSPHSAAYENPFAMLNYENETISGKVISLVFQDEADIFAVPPFSINSPSNVNHNRELPILRNRLNNFADNYYNGVLFQIATIAGTQGEQDEIDAFRTYMDAINSGKGVYSGTNGLSDKSEVRIKLDVTPASTAQYYTDLIVEELNNLGFNIT